MTACASAGSPIDFVSAAGLVQVPQILIGGLKISRIDVLMHYGVVRADEGNYPYHPCCKQAFILNYLSRHDLVSMICKSKNPDLSPRELKLVIPLNKTLENSS